MKFKYRVICCCALAMAALTTSCKDFLDQENPNDLLVENYWDSLADCRKGLTAVYNAFKDESIYTVCKDANRADITWPGDSQSYPDATDVYYLHTFTSSESIIKNKWADIYTGIWRTNQLIEGLYGIEDMFDPDDDDDEDNIEEWTLLMAQARFFRGLFHFYAYCAFNEGRVPIVTGVYTISDGLDFYPVCSTRADVEAFIREEMEYAEEHLPVKGSGDDWESGDYGRPNSESASAILGLTYLYENEPAYNDPTKKPSYATAAEYFKKIIDNSSYALADIADNWTNINEFNSESILEINYTFEYNDDYDGNQKLTHTLSADLASNDSGGTADIFPSHWLYRAFVKEPIDKKRDDSKVYLETDPDGEIYYYNNPDYRSSYWNTAGTQHTYYYYVVAQYNETYAEDYNLNSKADWLVNGEFYIFRKPYRVSATDETDRYYEDYWDAWNNGASYVLCKSNDATAPPSRNWKALRNEGTWDIYDIETNKIRTTDAITIDNSGCYRWKSNSLRASHSLVIMTDEDMPFYQKWRALGLPADDQSDFTNVNSYFRKYTNWATAENEDDRTDVDSDINFRLIRLADIYLLYAECLIEGGENDDAEATTEALKYINRVRRRAGTILIGKESLGEFSGECTYQDEPGTDADLYDVGNDFVIETAQEIMDHLMYIERPLELCVEGIASRQIDLRRWNITQSRLTELSKQPYAMGTFTFANIANFEAAATTGNTAIYQYEYDYVGSDDEFGSNMTGPLYQYKTSATNYTNDRAYLPIPNDEIIANPYLNPDVE